MSKLRFTTFGILLFSSGILFGRFSFGILPAARLPTSKLTDSNGSKPFQVPIASCPSPNSESSISANLSDQVFQSTGKTPRGSSQGPTSTRTELKSEKIAIENHDKYLELIDTKILAGPIERHFEIGDGTTGTEQSVSDGGSLFRLFNENKNFIAESWKQSSGSEINREYYENGAIRAFSLKNPNGSTILVSLTESGIFKARVDGFPDGSKISYDYNDRGEIIGRVKIAPNGVASRIQ